ncbi:cell division cycle-associated protein 7 [Abrus precatorius]|uniref:Cell division cycle-associated protein 7 n=1 Tax=Abrus precatorius TaxID=3816 RepID=A0A8B8M1W6_ABRPR|nr:cell division cycle-associated protein 7 [Abrus precatorius]
MPALRKRTRTPDSAGTPQAVSHDDQHHKVSEYELSREQRIRQNRERMGKLGIFDLSLSLKLKSHPPSTSRSTHKPKTPPSLYPSAPAPLRRSSRLQNVTPVSYSEVLPPKKTEVLENGRIVIEEGSKPELYTDEHEKLLGNTQKTWTLFVDGCGKDGKRIYDSVQGKTCHQCRQKTLGYRTRCSQCNMVQGQFCGDCLYMRYGEHVLEALQNPTWICPVCRGICNCSLCRQAKGWAPTGPLYKKVSGLGYRSVAHYLIQTRRSDINVEKNAVASNSVSAKRSLPFSDVDNESHEVENHPGSLKPLAEKGDGEEVSAKRSLFFSSEQDLEKVDCSDTPKSLQLKKKVCSNTMKQLASSSKSLSDSIAGRLRSRLKKT